MKEESFDLLEEIEIWEAWEHDLGTEIPKEMWEDCVSAKQVTQNISVTPTCPRCNDPTPLGHMFWSSLLWSTSGPLCLDDFQFIAGYV